MPQETTYYQLKKPLETETYNVDVFNDNFDAIDNQMHVNAEAIKTKQDTIKGAASTITDNPLTVNRVVISDASGKVKASDISTTILGYLGNVTSDIQAQFTALNTAIGTAQSTANGKVSKSGDTMTGNLIISRSGYYQQLQLKRSDMPLDENITGYMKGSCVSFKDTGGNDYFVIYPVKDSSNTRAWLEIGRKVGDEKVIAGLGGYVTSSGDKYFVAPTPSSTTDDSTKIATTHWVTNAGCVVHTDGNETINGDKTFSSSVTVSNVNERGFLIKRTGKALGESWARYRWDQVLDKNNARVMEFLTTSDDTGTYSRIVTHYLIDGVDTTAELGVRTRKDGTHYGNAPTTPSNATSNEIATANWCNSKFVGLSGNQVVGGIKTFTQEMWLNTWSPKLLTRDTNGDFSKAPSETTTPFYIQNFDKNGVAYGNILSMYHDTNDALIFNFGIDARTWATGIQVVSPKTGTSYATAPPSSPDIRSLRNITVSTSTPSGGHDGDLWIVIKG